MTRSGGAQPQSEGPSTTLGGRLRVPFPMEPEASSRPWGECWRPDAGRPLNARLLGSPALSGSVPRSVSPSSARGMCWGVGGGRHTMQGGRGTRHAPQPPGEAQVHHRRDVKQTGAKRSGQKSERPSPPYQPARGPRTQRPHRSRTARPLGTRKSDFPASVVSPQRAATQRAGRVAAFGAWQPGSPALRATAEPRGAHFLPLRPATASAALGP